MHFGQQPALEYTISIIDPIVAIKIGDGYPQNSVLEIIQRLAINPIVYVIFAQPVN